MDREFRVLQALEKTAVPVPRVFSLCMDPSVLGTPFYIMEFLDGRIITDPFLSGINATDRRKMWEPTPMPGT